MHKPLGVLRALVRCLPLLGFALVAPAVHAKPITYTGFTITDGKLGSWAFHDARVYLTFAGDTDDVQFFQPAFDPTDPSQTVDTYMIANGTAAVTIMSGAESVHATFAPNQIFVSLDQGDTVDAPHLGARGVGFGSFSATAPGGIEPAYPLGIEDGTIDWGDVVDDGFSVSNALESLSTDLVHDVGFSGRGWVCPGFPDPTCPPATAPLTTDRGDLYLYQPYDAYFGPDGSYGSDSANAGFFVASTSTGCDRDEATRPLQPFSTGKSSSVIRYNAYAIADVSLGRHHFSAAQVYLSFDADPAAVTPFSDGDSYGYVNSTGKARVRVIANGRTIDADFAPDQLYVFYDLAHAAIGFGSSAGGAGYPLTLTAHDDQEGLGEPTTLGGATSIALGTVDTSTLSYSSAVNGLVTDLTNATVLSGAASSCASFDLATSVCSNLAPVPLHTNRGDFTISEPYTAGVTTTDGSQPYSVNWGVFWSELAVKPHR